MKSEKTINFIFTALLILASVVFLAPIVIVFLNSFKSKFSINQAPFIPPNSETFVGLENYITGIDDTNFLTAFLWSLFVTVGSVAVIVIFTSMTAWYIVRVKNKITKLLYYLFVFSMIVPFQMVMYTMTYYAFELHLNNPIGIIFIYLGFGSGLSVFMFSGFIKSIPLEIEEAADIDGCNAVRTFFFVVVPIMKSTYISVAILQMMWVWNDYLLPYLVLDRTKYMTVPIHIQFLQGSFGRVDYGATMALIIICLLPIVILYAFSQKHIIRGVLSGAVKG